MSELVVFIFPGQGSQYVGMHQRLIRPNPLCRQRVEEAEDLLRIPLQKLMDQGPEEELRRTCNAQPALLAVGVACAEELNRRGLDADMVMGHSLGEYTALVHASSLSFADGLRLVRARGELMERASASVPGKMAAVIGVDPDLLAEIVERHSTRGVIVVSNYNAPTQTVISGEAAAVDGASEEIAHRRLGKVLALPVSAPFHCPLMKPAASKLAEALDAVALRAPAKRFIDNVDGREEADPLRIKEKLVAQLTCPVRWTTAVRNAFQSGGRRFVECGPSRVLIGLVRRTVPGATLDACETLLSDQDRTLT